MMKKNEGFLAVPLKSQPLECVILAALFTEVIDDGRAFY